jgi:tetratricopeptide (TPR) repeat protein
VSLGQHHISLSLITKNCFTLFCIKRFLCRFQIFHEVIGHLPRDAEAKQEMLTVCRQHYQDSETMLKTINDFDRTYRPDDCVQWYTQPTFVYRLINEALRQENIEKLYQFRYFIADLSRRLAQGCKTLKSQCQAEGKIILYRGTSLHKEELERLKLMEGKFFATNDYWSSSHSHAVADCFVAPDSERMPVLYEIKCDLHHCENSIIFADISNLSAFDQEEEYLFDAGSVFQVEHITERVGDGPYVIKIKTTEKGGELARQFREEYREELKYESPRIIIGILLKRIGQYEKSLNYFRKLLENPGNEKRSHIHNRLGIALLHQNKCEEALEHLDEAYRLTLELYPSEKIRLALIRHSRGLVFDKQSRFDEAFCEYKRAIRIFKTPIRDPNRSSADIYGCIARYYFRKKKSKRAKFYQRKVLKIRKSCLPPEHHHHAFSYLDMAKTCFRERNFPGALKYNVKALELRQKCLLPDHANIASSLYYTGKAYDANKRPTEALDHYRKALDMTRKCFPASQQLMVPDILESIATHLKGTPEEALKHLFEAYEARQKLKRIDYARMARTLDDIARTYKTMGNNNKFNEYRNKASRTRTEKITVDFGRL